MTLDRSYVHELYGETGITLKNFLKEVASQNLIYI